MDIVVIISHHHGGLMLFACLRATETREFPRKQRPSIRAFLEHCFCHSLAAKRPVRQMVRFSVSLASFRKFHVCDLCCVPGWATTTPGWVFTAGFSFACSWLSISMAPGFCKAAARLHFQNALEQGRPTKRGGVSSVLRPCKTAYILFPPPANVTGATASACTKLNGKLFYICRPIGCLRLRSS